MITRLSTPKTNPTSVRLFGVISAMLIAEHRSIRRWSLNRGHIERTRQELIDRDGLEWNKWKIKQNENAWATVKNVEVSILLFTCNITSSHPLRWMRNIRHISNGTHWTACSHTHTQQQQQQQQHWHSRLLCSERYDELNKWIHGYV